MKPLVPVEAALPHIAPGLKGIGRTRVGELTGVNPVTVWRVRSMKRKRMRFQTANRLFNTPVASRADGALISSAKARSMLKRLYAEGYSKTAIVRMSGVSLRTIDQIPMSHHVKVSTSKAIRRLYDRLVGHESDR